MDDRDESFVTADGEDGATIPNEINYDLSPAVVCLDCSIDVAVTPKEFLLGQRAISAAQIAREGKNVRVVAHVRQDVQRSYKEMYVDVTGKLPAFARAVLPQLLLYMENAVDYPRNTASLVCLKPKSLRGTCAFSETMITNLGENPKFSMKVPTHLATPHEIRKVDHTIGWKQIGSNSKTPKCTVHKRFLLDVGSESFFYRNLRSFMIRKFIDAFVDMVREVEICVRGWHEGVEPFDESQCCQGGAAPGPQFWPKEGESVRKRVEMVIADLQNKAASPNLAMSGKIRGRERKSSSFFVGVE